MAACPESCNGVPATPSQTREIDSTIPRAAGGVKDMLAALVAFGDP
jgi:hypothetical protein